MRVVLSITKPLSEDRIQNISTYFYNREGIKPDLSRHIAQDLIYYVTMLIHGEIDKESVTVVTGGYWFTANEYNLLKQI